MNLSATELTLEKKTRSKYQSEKEYDIRCEKILEQLIENKKIYSTKRQFNLFHTNLDRVNMQKMHFCDMCKRLITLRIQQVLRYQATDVTKNLKKGIKNSCKNELLNNFQDLRSIFLHLNAFLKRDSKKYSKVETTPHLQLMCKIAEDLRTIYPNG